MGVYAMLERTLRFILQRRTGRGGDVSSTERAEVWLSALQESRRGEAENVVYRHHCTVILQANRKGIISDVLYEERRGRLPHQYQC